VVDDDRRIRDLLSRFLHGEGYRVTTADNAADARAKLGSLSFDLLVLDVMMPGETGFQLARSLRQTSSVPILMLTAKAEADSRITGLEIGADDYVSKPFSPRELTSRVKAVLRRAGGAFDAAPSAASRISAGDLVIDVPARQASRGDDQLLLTAREFDLMVFLASRPRQVFRRDELLEHVWGYTYGDTATVTVHVRRLREKIEPDPSQPLHLVTVWGVGYRWDP